MLIVDDDKDMCRVISDVLKEEGMKVDIAYEGRSALEKIKKYPIDLMILDYKLNGVSGLEVLEKACQIRPELKTIMISACADALIKARAKELGAYAFLDKPFNIDRLKITVKKALTEQRRRCADVTNWQKLHSYSTPGEHSGSTGFGSTAANSCGKDRHPVHIGAG